MNSLRSLCDQVVEFAINDHIVLIQICEVCKLCFFADNNLHAMNYQFLKFILLACKSGQQSLHIKLAKSCIGNIGEVQGNL